MVPAKPTAEDANLASLTSASMMIHENVWNESTGSSAREDKKEMEPEYVDGQDRVDEPSEPVAEESTAAPTPIRSDEPSDTVPTESVHEPIFEREAAHECSNTSSEPAPSSVRSAFSRLGTRVAEWRQARAAAQEEAKKQAEAEHTKGWRRVAPASTNTSSKLGSWLKRAPPPEKDATPSAQPPSSSTMLNADDLAWLDAATSKKEAAPQASDNAPSTYQDMGDSLAPGLGPMTLSTNAYNPVDDNDANDDDDDEFGEIQTYTDGPAPLYDAPISTRPGPYVDRGGGEQYSALASHTEPTYRDTPKKAPQVLLPPSPPKVNVRSSSPPRKGGLSSADLDFFENL